MIVHNNTYIRTLIPGLGDLRRIGLPCYCPIAPFIKSDLLFRDAARYQVVLAFMPDPLPSVE